MVRNMSDVKPPTRATEEPLLL